MDCGHSARSAGPEWQRDFSCLARILHHSQQRSQSSQTTPGMQDDCRDAGGRATPGAVAELE
ncbi:MAG: hypothetical protein FVQ76_04685 [Nitrospira sp.]|nr:hypothetical protein [Nitrospira sp.]